MSQLHLVKMRSQASEHVIFTRKNKKKVERKLELTKFDPTTRKREVYKEVKKIAFRHEKAAIRRMAALLFAAVAH